MHRSTILTLFLGILAILSIATLFGRTQSPPPGPNAPTLADFWAGRATWQIDIHDVGLPVGESDTLFLDAAPGAAARSYLHASHESANVVDQCGQPVAFPGCLTLWHSDDGGTSFTLPVAICLLPCHTCPCDDARDHITAQQYPRVVRADDGTHYMAYEWHAQVMLRRSSDGLIWSDWSYLTIPGGTWPLAHHPCDPIERIGPHPNIRGQADGCLVGGPPGLYVEADTLYVFVMAGSAPSHMRCYKGNRHGDLGALARCDHDPLFGGARDYGPEDTFGADANPYFDFRYVSSADVLRVGQRYYMTYEGIRGPDVLERGMDTQFGLGFARATTDHIDGPWEVYPGNPVLMDMTFNWGVGHADLIVRDGITYLYTATSQTTRGRYRLAWTDE